MTLSELFKKVEYDKVYKVLDKYYDYILFDKEKDIERGFQEMKAMDILNTNNNMELDILREDDIVFGETYKVIMADVVNQDKSKYIELLLIPINEQLGLHIRQDFINIMPEHEILTHCFVSMTAGDMFTISDREHYENMRIEWCELRKKLKEQLYSSGDRVSKDIKTELYRLHKKSGIKLSTIDIQNEVEAYTEVCEAREDGKEVAEEVINYLKILDQMYD